uniref:3-methyl-2-oxobutanoate hydroxymethyltransferase n=1 Tax=Ditylenchus dipsaci TaxID=166011 RepID=A0A915E6X5_9BILA
MFLGLREMDKDHTAENILTATEELLGKFDLSLDSIFKIVTDNGSNVLAAFKDIQIRYLRSFFSEAFPQRISCFAHSLQLVILKFFKDDVIFFSGYKKIMHVVKKVKISPKLKKELHERCGATVKLPSTTRWGSLIEVIRQFLEVKQSLGEIQSLKTLMPTAEEIHELQVILQIFRPFVAVLKRIQAEKSYINVAEFICPTHLLTTKMVLTNGSDSNAAVASPSLPLKAKQPITVPKLRQMKEDKQKIVMLTAYDASFSLLMDQAGVDVILVGDSLGNLIQGEDSTLPVTLPQMVYHTKAVHRGLTRSSASPTVFLIADMPFLCMQSVQQAVTAGAALLAEAGAAMIKVEGATDLCLDIIKALTTRSIPVSGHLGLTPQSVHSLGGYKVQGKEESAAEKLVADALAVQQAGAQLLVIECVPEKLGQRVSKTLDIPVIGIGAGPQCDGQSYDILGISGKKYKFTKNFLAETGDGSIFTAIANYVADVREGKFPDDKHSFH